MATQIPLLCQTPTTLSNKSVILYFVLFLASAIIYWLLHALSFTWIGWNSSIFLYNSEENKIKLRSPFYCSSVSELSNISPYFYLLKNEKFYSRVSHFFQADAGSYSESYF